MKRVTTGDLLNMDACVLQLRVFQRTFGDEALPTVDNAKRAAAAELSFWWVADRLLPTLQYFRYRSIRRELENRRKSHDPASITFRPLHENRWAAFYENGWAAFAAAALKLDIKPTGCGFDALGEERVSFWGKLFGWRGAN